LTNAFQKEKITISLRKKDIMREFLSGLFQTQNIPEGSREGLPYWIFWLLLLVIMLLLTFIFLRDKDFRRRLDSFFSGLRKRLVKLRLQSILKKEKQKQIGFLTSLGQTSRDHKLSANGGEGLNTQLGEIENKLSDLTKTHREHTEKIQDLNHDLDEFRRTQEKQIQRIQSERIPFQENLDRSREEGKDIATEVSRLHNLREETMKELNLKRKSASSREADADAESGTIEEEAASIKKMEKTLAETDGKIEKLVRKKTDLEKASEKDREEIEAVEKKIKSLNEETRNESKVLQKEIKEWGKNLAKLQERIKALESEKTPLFKSLGRLLDEHRDPHPDLAPIYSKIDRTRRRIEDIEKQIQEQD
jgi:chromosome segregation ATPase